MHSEWRWGKAEKREGGRDLHLAYVGHKHRASKANYLIVSLMRHRQVSLSYRGIYGRDYSRCVCGTSNHHHPPPKRHVDTLTDRESKLNTERAGWLGREDGVHCADTWIEGVKLRTYIPLCSTVLRLILGHEKMGGTTDTRMSSLAVRDLT